MRRIVAATRNPGKLAEMRRLLAHLPLDVVGLEGTGVGEPPEETGQTYLSNAREKALHACRGTGLASFGDDSGLEVDALGGAPGIWSARWDGEAGTAQSRNAKLLREMVGVVDPAKRSARFRAVVVLTLPDGRGGFVEESFEGVLEGAISFDPFGLGGFGYDPVFYVPDFATTVASLAPERKDEVSHRGRAMRALAGWLSANLHRIPDR